MKQYKVGLVGATGMVGKVFVQLLAERKFPVSELRPFASDASQGKKIELNNKSWEIKTLTTNCFEGLDLVFFSSGDDISKEWGPIAVKAGAYVIDNSAAFRMDPEIPLIVPEVNWTNEILKKPCLIANPNCSTIQLVVALKPLRDSFGIEDVRVSSYQAVSGAGQAGYDELLDQTKKYPESISSQTFARQILFNCIPQIGSFDKDGFTSEEVKIMNETRKILNEPKLKVSAFTVRVPALNAHSETVWVTLSKQINEEQIHQALSGKDGLVFIKDHNQYPTALDVSGKDPVYVGRVHKDPNDLKTWMLWIVSDNIKKGAALNGIQIAEKIITAHD